MTRIFRQASVLCLSGLAAGAPAAAAATVPAVQQGSVSTSELRELERRVDDLRDRIETLRDRDTALARSLQTEADELRDEAIYLRVKARRDTVTRAEISDLRDRIDRFERRVSGGSSGGITTGVSTGGDRSGSERVVRREGEVPVGQEIDVRLQSSLSSETAQVEDRFEATTLVDLQEGERVLIPAGSTLRGTVKSVQRAGRLDRRASLTLAFDLLRIGERSYPIRATVSEALESGGYREDAGRIGAGAAVGAIIGGILGGFKGAMAGVLIGGGGTIAATEGKDLRLDVGTVLRVRFDEPVQVVP
jgi:hypothetical protein